MKRLLITAAAILLVSASVSQAKPPVHAEVSFNYFYHSLAPHGEWIEIDYDLVVWRPNRVHRHWQPYSDGRWSWTEYGWYWESYEPFGWATYHYGRWFYDDYYGWVWVPDYEWGPSWVEWRYSNDYIGWAPLPPYAGFRVDVGIHFSVSWNSPYQHWHFVRYNNFCRPNVNIYVVNSYDAYNIYPRTKYRTNYYHVQGRIINGGVDKYYVETRTKTRVTTRTIVTTDKYRSYDAQRNYETDKIEAYRPSSREVEKYRNTEVTNVRKADRTTALKRESIAVGGKSRTVNKESYNTKERLADDRPAYIESRRDYDRTYERPSRDPVTTTTPSPVNSGTSKSKEPEYKERETSSRDRSLRSKEVNNDTNKKYNDENSTRSSRTNESKSSRSYDRSSSSKDRSSSESYSKSNSNSSSRSKSVEKRSTSSRRR